MTPADLRELNDRLSTDDAPLWAEVLGAVLAPTIALRGGVHAVTALVGARVTGEAIDPHTAGHGLTLASPIRGLRGHRLDRVARYLTAVIGVGGLAWVHFPAIAQPVPRAYVALNCVALAADPFAWAICAIRTRRSTTMTEHTTATDGGTER